MRISAEDLCSLTPTTQFNTRDRVRSEVICFVLAGISKQASNFARLKYANDRSKKKEVAFELVRRVKKRAPKALSKRELMELALVAIEESLADSLCGTCNGKTWVSTGMKRIVCFRCKGTGKRNRGSKEISDRLDWGYHYYVHFGKRVIERDMLGILSAYEGELHNAFRNRLY